MATTITIEKPAEDLNWPKRCVCCGGLDETDLEVIVQDTIDSRRPLDEVITAEVPHCLDCMNHQGIGLTGMQILAFLVVLAFAVGALLAFVSGHVGSIVVSALAVIAAVYIVDRLRIRAAMKRTCSAAGKSYRFVHPCGRAITTITFASDDYAREFRAVNGRGVYER